LSNAVGDAASSGASVESPLPLAGRGQLACSDAANAELMLVSL
jgi:hypothetical protein